MHDRIDDHQFVETLRSAGVSTVYEAAERNGGMDPGIRPITEGQLLCGRALTVRCQPGDNLAVHQAVARASRGDVLVVDGGGVIVGYWGEILTAAARKRGVAGLVIDGGVRDVGRLRELAFPVWSRGISMRSAMKVATGAVAAPVTCGGVEIATGDWVLADDDGVVIVAAASATIVLERTLVRLATEAGFLEQIEQGVSTLDLFNLREVPGEPGS